MLAKASQPSPPCYAGARERYGRNVSMSPDYDLSPRKRSANCHIHVARRRVRADLPPRWRGGANLRQQIPGGGYHTSHRAHPLESVKNGFCPPPAGDGVSPHPASAMRILTFPDGRGNAARRTRAPPVTALHARIRVRKNGEIKSQFFVYSEQVPEA